MAVQVVTNDNIQEFISTGKVAPFVPPTAEVEAKAPDAKPEGDKAAPASPSEGETKQPRASDGKFESPTGEKPGETKGKAAPQPADDDPDAANLTEHARRVIGKKHRQMKEAEEFARKRDADAAAERARADSLQRQLDEARKGEKSGQGPATEKGESVDPDEPNQNDFKTVGEYTRALTKYEVKKAASAAAEKGKQNGREAAEQAIGAAFTQRQQEFMKVRLDYEQVLEDSELDIPNVGLSYIVESEVGPQLALYLVEHPDDANRLRGLSPRRVIAELGKLEPKAEAAYAVKKPEGGTPATAQPEVSRAPAPTKPLDDKAASAVQKDPKDMTFQELRAHREAERRAGKRM